MSSAGDARAREEALDSSRSFIVRAPAGSGKTGLLIQRYLKLLSEVDAPEEVLAITFTIKAAAEMRERVLDVLESVPESTSSGEFENTTQRLAGAVRQRDTELEWHLRDQPARLRIQTIDAFCLSLVRQMAWLSNLGGEMRPVEDATAHYQQAAGEVFALLEGQANPWQAPISTVLRHLDNDVPRFRQMLVSMLARRDQWLRHLASLEDGGERLSGPLRRLTKDALEQLSAEVPQAAGNDLLRVAVAGKRIGERAALPGTQSADLDDWVGIAAAVLTKDGKPRVRFSTNQGFPGAADPDSKTFKTSVEQVAQALADNPLFVERLHAIRALPPLVIEDADRHLVNALMKVLKVALGLLRVVFGEHGEVDFIELVNAAQSALGEPENPTDLALSLDYRFRHILVDEFQDTSYNQIELLGRLTAGWEPDDGRTLFLVGDPMQSIYRFREADVGLYLDVKARGVGALKLQPITLTSNFRSASALVEWTNKIFSTVLPGLEDVATGAVTFSHSEPGSNAPEPGSVSMHCVFDDTDDQRARLVATLISEARVHSHTIAVLVRARTHLPPILTALKLAGIEYRGVDLHPLQAMPVVQDVLSLTRALVYPADRIAWLAVLRAPWCGLRLADLLGLMRGAGEHAVLERLAERGVVDGLSADGKERCVRMHAILRAALSKRGRTSLRQWVEQTWLELGAPVCLREGEITEADAFFDLLDEIDQQPAPDFDRLNTLIGERYSPAATSQTRVEVMTIHAAKGLEFDTVIVPALERGARAEEKRMLQWSERLLMDGRSELLVAPQPAVGQEPSSLYTYLRQLEGRRASNEAARLAYVAATRARKHLHLIGAVDASKGKLKPPRHDSLLAHLWPAVSAEFEEALAAGRNPRQLGLDMPEPPAFIRRIPVDWRNPIRGTLNPENDGELDVLEFEWAGVAAKHVGTLVHRMLNLMSAEGAGAWTRDDVEVRRPRFAAELSVLGVPPEELETAVSSVTCALSNVLDDPTGRWVLDPAHEDAHSELAITGVVEGVLVNGILDRTFADVSSTRWIIDYKTGRHTGGRLEEFLDRERIRYEPQLQRYAVLMANLDPRPIRLGLYFPVHAGWRECDLPSV